MGIISPPPSQLGHYKKYAHYYSLPHGSLKQGAERVTAPAYIGYDVVGSGNLIFPSVPVADHPAYVAEFPGDSTMPVKYKGIWTVQDANEFWNTQQVSYPMLPYTDSPVHIPSFVAGISPFQPYLYTVSTSYTSPALKFNMWLCPRLTVPGWPTTASNRTFIRGGKVDGIAHNSDTWDGFFYAAAISHSPIMPGFGSRSCAAVLKAVAYYESNFDPDNTHGLMNYDNGNTAIPPIDLGPNKQFTPEGGIDAGALHFTNDWTSAAKLLNSYSVNGKYPKPSMVSIAKAAVLSYNRGQRTLKDSCAEADHFATHTHTWTPCTTNFHDLFYFVPYACRESPDDIVRNKWGKMARTALFYVADTFGGEYFTKGQDLFMAYSAKLTPPTTGHAVAASKGNAWVCGFGEAEGTPKQ